MLKIISNLITALFILTAPSLFADDVLNNLGVQLPSLILTSPDSFSANQILSLQGLVEKHWLNMEDAIPFLGYPAKLNLKFHISDRGGVDSLTLTPLNRKNLFDKFKRSLLALRFHPSIIDGAAVPFILPAELLIGSEKFFGITHLEKPSAVLRIPYLKEIGVIRRDLLEESLILNGFELPGVKEFPPYYCFFKIGEKAARYPFAIYKISLDSAGEVNDYTEYCSSRPTYSEGFSRSIMHAEYHPAGWRGMTRPSEFYLLVRFFDRLQYPTYRWPQSYRPELDFPFEYIRLESTVSLDSIINPPLPLNIPDGLFHSNILVPFADSLRAFVKIDTVGKIVSTIYGSPFRAELERLADEILQQLEFSPARDLLDRKVDFRGELLLLFGAGKITRIRAEWLSRISQPEAK